MNRRGIGFNRMMEDCGRIGSAEFSGWVLVQARSAAFFNLYLHCYSS